MTVTIQRAIRRWKMRRLAARLQKQTLQLCRAILRLDTADCRSHQQRLEAELARVSAGR